MLDVNIVMFSYNYICYCYNNSSSSDFHSEKYLSFQAGLEPTFPQPSDRR